MPENRKALYPVSRGIPCKCSATQEIRVQIAQTLYPCVTPEQGVRKSSPTTILHLTSSDPDGERGSARHEARGLLASGSYEGLIVHTDAGEVVFQDTKRGGPWWALDFHPDGRRVVGVNDWGTVECFDLD